MKTLLITLLFLPSLANACSCSRQLTLEEKFARAAHVAVVRVEAAKLNTESFWATEFSGVDSKGKKSLETEITVRASAVVIETLKGKPSKRVTIIAAAPGDECYEELLVGETYVLFWSGDIAPQNACNEQPPLSRVPAQLLEVWRHAP